jgi:transcriptional regulator with XRE-family HTH domain
MPQVSGPLGPRRRIATVLKRWRDESGKSLTEVADVTLISTSKLSRLENAEGKPRLRDVRDLIGFFGKQDTKEAGQLERWVTAADVSGWWKDYDENVLQSRNGFDAHLAYEDEATVARLYTLPFVPALLATDAYAEAIYREMERRPEDQIPALMEIRRKRKEALKGREGRDPLKLIAVTHECTLRQVVGSPQILRDQLDELLVRSHEHNVSLHVFPFSATPVPTITCMYAIFEYENDLEQDLMQIETQAGFWTIGNPERVAEYKKAHESLVAFSLSEDDSRALIKSIRDSIPPTSLSAASSLRALQGSSLAASRKKHKLRASWQQQGDGNAMVRFNVPAGLYLAK